MYLRACARFALRPRALEAGSIADRTEPCKEAAIIGNRLFDEIARRRLEDGAALSIVRLKQVLAAPTLQHGGKLPSQIARVLKSDVNAIPPVRRMAVGRIASHKDAARAIAIGNREAQVPKPDVIERNVKLGAGRRIEKLAKVEIVLRRAGRDGSVEKPAAAEVHPAKELPVAVKLRVENAVEGFAGIARQQAVQAVRAKHQQHHQPIMVRQGLADAGLGAHPRTAPVAANDILGAQRAPTSSSALREQDLYVACVLAHHLGTPAIERGHARKLLCAPAQDGLGRILRQALI